MTSSKFLWEHFSFCFQTGLPLRPAFLAAMPVFAVHLHAQAHQQLLGLDLEARVDSSIIWIPIVVQQVMNFTLNSLKSKNVKILYFPF